MLSVVPKELRTPVSHPAHAVMFLLTEERAAKATDCCCRTFRMCCQLLSKQILVLLQQFQAVGKVPNNCAKNYG